MSKSETVSNISLITPNGIRQNVINISYVSAEDEDSLEVIAYLRYHEKDYFGYGTDFLWIDAIADLQKKLPDGVFLKCCVACKHGNLCPVGNSANEVFCMKDIVPRKKSDLFFYTEDDSEREKRSKEYFKCCESFDAQNENYYTYNDFLYFLNK